jgi:hypothetical protein
MMSATAQIIVAIGLAAMLFLIGLIGVIWSIRWDPKRSHYRLPSLVALSGPVGLALLVLLKLR